MPSTTFKEQIHLALQQAAQSLSCLPVLIANARELAEDLCDGRRTVRRESAELHLRLISEWKHLCWRMWSSIHRATSSLAQEDAVDAREIDLLQDICHSFANLNEQLAHLETDLRNGMDRASAGLTERSLVSSDLAAFDATRLLARISDGAKAQWLASKDA